VRRRILQSGGETSVVAGLVLLHGPASPHRGCRQMIFLIFVVGVWGEAALLVVQVETHRSDDDPQASLGLNLNPLWRR